MKWRNAGKMPGVMPIVPLLIAVWGLSLLVVAVCSRDVPDEDLVS